MIKLMKKTFSEEEETKKKLCEFITDAKRLSMGSKCKQFETEFAKYQGREYAVLLNSGSSANLALISALVNMGKLNKDDNVGFSSLTWATNTMPLIQCGLNAIPIDVSSQNLNITSETLLDYLNSGQKLKALFITNLLGFCGDLDKIKEICEERNILLLEDNCESLGSELQNKKLGNFGFASSFSFFVGHHMSTVEGGMVCTDDKELYDLLLMVRAHGWSRELDEEKTKELREKHGISKFHEMYTFYIPGYNLRPTEITGVIGIEQLKYLEENFEKRNKIFNIYEKTVKQNPDTENLDLSHMNFVCNFAYPITFKDKETFEKYQEKFEGIAEIRPLVGGCIPNQPFFKNKDGKYPNAEKINNLSFYVPNNPDLTDEEVETIRKLLSKD